MKKINYICQPGGKLQGAITVPGDKSISHRSIMLGALAQGTTEVTGFLEGEDSLATLQAFRDMGVVIEGPQAGQLQIHGVGLHGLKPSDKPLYLGNSGTSMRLLTGLLAGQSFDSVLTGDESLSKRPMKRVTDPLTQMGAKIQTTEQGTPPVRIKGGQSLTGIRYTLPIASAQVKSSILLAGLYAQGKTCVTEPAITRDHTERMLQAFGWNLEVNKAQVCLGDGSLRAQKLIIPADISSAAFFLVGASIAPGSDITLKQVGINSTRIGVINLLKQMGADITLTQNALAGAEPVADIRVRSAPLHGIEIPLDQVSLAIDEFPALFIAAAVARGETLLRGAEELRVKESDRIQVMADGLQALGIAAQALPDGIRIQGGQLQGGVIDSAGDHRIAMAFAIASLCAAGPVHIKDCANVATSFPGFVELARSAGLRINIEND